VCREVWSAATVRAGRPAGLEEIERRAEDAG
jgi:hypothetical protein